MYRKVVKIGFAPTKRVPFNHPQTFEVRDAIYAQIKKWDLEGIIEVVGIDDVTPKNILETEDDVIAVVEKFKKENVDGVFFPHCNFGCEAAVAGVARALKLPVLLWGPRDDDTEANGGSEFGVGVGRPRDSQCGLFATGKALRRVNVPFTYIPNTDVTDFAFERGYKAFAAVCAAVRDFKETQVLQVGTRPEPFWTVMINEGEILEKFGIRVLPIANVELAQKAEALMKDEPARVAEAAKMITDTEKPFMTDDPKCEVPSQAVSNDQITRLGAYYVAMLDLSKQLKCNAAAMQCWAPFRTSMGIAACGINGYLADAGLPVACETDIHGVIGTRLLQAATLYNSNVFFADLTVRHRYNENSELLWHCGNFPPSMAEGEKTIWQEGRSHFECKKGEPITIVRFDGDHGEYSMLIGEGVGVEGPRTGGTYSWCEVKDWVAWEDKIVKGPYIHHSCCAYGQYMPIVAEACMYLGIKADFADEGVDKACKEFWYGR